MLEKKQIIQLVQELGERIGSKDLSELFQNDNTPGDNKIGHGQFRELAALCGAAECYEEIELLVKYNTAKAAEKSKYGGSWAKECYACNHQKFGDLIVDYMKKIQESEQNDADFLTDLMHFFGYLYWQSRVWTAENPSQPKNSGYGDHKTDFQKGQKPYNGNRPLSQNKGGRL